MDELQAADDAYEAAEAAFLGGIRSGSDLDTLGVLAVKLAAVADTYNEVAYAKLHAARPDERQDLDALTERTEVLSELWDDIAEAFARR